MATNIITKVQKTMGLTGRFIQPNKLSVPYFVSNKLRVSEAVVVGNCEIILAKMTVEIPLPIPCSVINSPIHIRISEPAVIVVIERIQSRVVGTKATVFVAATD